MLVLCVLIFAALFYAGAAFAAASFDDGAKVTGWRRWLRFLALLPWV
jgi:TRAP-type C4-dicarboxylate transport system permease small subunit